MSMHRTAAPAASTAQILLFTTAADNMAGTAAQCIETSLHVYFVVCTFVGLKQFAVVILSRLA